MIESKSMQKTCLMIFHFLFFASFTKLNDSPFLFTYKGNIDRKIIVFVLTFIVLFQIICFFKNFLKFIIL